MQISMRHGKIPRNVHELRVATNLENLEYSARDFSEHEKPSEFSGNCVQLQGKIVTNKVFLVRRSNACVKQPLTGVDKQDH